MQALPQSIQTEQVKLTGKKPVFSVDINDYTFPAKPDALRPDYFNWRKLWSGWHTWWDHYSSNDPDILKWFAFGTTPSYPTGADLVGGKPLYWPPPCWSPCMCVTKNNTLLIWDGVTGYHRYENPGVDTDFSAWIPAQEGTVEQAPVSYFPMPGCLVASPVNDEVIAFHRPLRGSGRVIYYEVSTNDGVGFGGFQYLPAIEVPLMTLGPNEILFVRAAYNEKGDLAVLAVLQHSLNTYLFYINVRENGLWSGWSGGVSPQCEGANPCLYGTLNLPDIGSRTGLSSADIAYDGDWFIVFSYQSGLGNTTVKTGWLVYGDGTNVEKGMWYMGGGEVRIADAYTKINSMNDVDHFSPTGGRDHPFVSVGLHYNHAFERTAWSVKPGRYSEDYGGGLWFDQDVLWGKKKPPTPSYRYQGDIVKTEHKMDLKNNRLFMDILRAGGVFANTDTYGEYRVVSVEEMYPYTSLLKVPGGPIIWCVHADDKMHFFRMRGDMTVKEAVFYRAYTIETTSPITLACSSNYVYGISNYQLYMSAIPYEWTAPNPIENPVGNACVMPSGQRILSINEDVEGNEAGRLVIDFDNSDGYFDAPGSGNLASLKEGSLLTLNMGFNIGGVDTVHECRKYFVESWSYTRSPNRKIFSLYCADGWGLLDQYIITSETTWNEFTDEYSAYDIISMMIQSIGGTLYNMGCSSTIKTTYPFMQLPPNTSAGNIVRQLLGEYSDVMWFNGNNAYIRDAKSSEGKIYSYAFPKSS